MTTSHEQVRHRRRWVVGLIFFVVIATGAAYAAIPRQADLTRFDPDAMARLETAMWRDYYDKRYFDLFRHLYAVSRREYGFSPLDSARIAVAAASAAKSFQPSTSREEAEAALPALTTYFEILARAAPVPVEVEDAARTELAWWQARREAVSPDEYGRIIARVATLMYGVDGEDMRRSGRVRAQAMDYRDRHAANTTEADWVHIEEQLRVADGLFKKALSPADR